MDKKEINNLEKKLRIVKATEEMNNYLLNIIREYKKEAREDAFELTKLKHKSRLELARTFLYVGLILSFGLVQFYISNVDDIEIDSNRLIISILSISILIVFSVGGYMLYKTNEIENSLDSLIRDQIKIRTQTIEDLKKMQAEFKKYIEKIKI